MAQFDLPFTLNSITTFLEAQPRVELESIERDERLPKSEHVQNPVDEERCSCKHRKSSEPDSEVQHNQFIQQKQNPISRETYKPPIKSLQSYLDELRNLSTQIIQKGDDAKPTLGLLDETQSNPRSSDFEAKGGMNLDISALGQESQPITGYFDIPRRAPPALKSRRTLNEIAIHKWLRELQSPTSPMALSPVESWSHHSSSSLRASAPLRELSLDQPEIASAVQSQSIVPTKTNCKKEAGQN